MSSPIYYTRTCPHCQATVSYKSKNHLTRALRKNQRCRSCLPCEPRPEHPCQQCGDPTKNPKYCSSSCAAKVTGHTSPKRKLEGICIDCGDSISNSNIRCLPCHGKRQTLDPGELTLEEYYNRPHIIGKHPSWRYNYIRRLARSWSRQREKKCQNCGYSRHVECAHVRAIASFPNDTKIKEVNAASNILILCRNCHWEFDHGMLVALAGLEPATLRVETVRS
jgi:HNH endonuclease